MSKIIKAISLFCLIVIAGCSHDVVTIPEQQIQEGEEIMVSFTTSIPEFKTIVTRANGGLNDMYLLVFDENGNYIARRQAALSGQTESGGNFTASLPTSSNKRIIHFISNYDWTGFSDTGGLNEAAVVALLSTQNPTFWSRMELNSGISSSSFNGTTVEMLRNQAKISVLNEAAELTYNGFTIHNTPTKGAVAPYSLSSGFTVGTITEPLDVALSPALETAISNEERYLFERKNALATNITTVIVKGTYNGQQYYYKIDLIDSEKNRYNIERNYHYIVKIKTVTRAGYVDFDDALAGASHNNTALDPIIEKYPIISDGTSKLEVERTLVVLTQPNQQFSVWTKYFPDINSETFDNTGVTVTIQPGNTSFLGSSLNFDPATGVITATGLNQLPVLPEQGEARIVVTKGDLARTIRVVLRTPFLFDPVTINYASPATLSGPQEQVATLRFNIPNDFPEDLFPLPIRIYTNGLYPATTGLEMVVVGDQIYYIYRADQKGEQIVEFKTNKSGNAETVTLKADYYADGAVIYNIINKSGNLTFGMSSTPVPYSLRESLSVTKGTIYMPSNEDGKYIWTLSTTQAAQQQTVSLEVLEGFIHKRYSRNLTPGTNPITNIHLNTETILGIVGAISYGGDNTTVPSGTVLPSGSTVAASTGSITIIADGQYIYTPHPDYTNSTTVTFTIEKQVSSHYKEHYTLTTTVGALIGNSTIALSPNNFIFEGTIQYRQGSWNNVPNNGNIYTSQGIGTFIMTSNGRYRYTVSTSVTNNIRFNYNRNGNIYYQSRTIEQLKNNASLSLTRN